MATSFSPSATDLRRLALSIAVLALACHPGVRKANALLKRGAVLEAEMVAAKEVQARPDDADARLVLAHVYMRQLRTDMAKKTLEPIAGDPKLALKIGEAYWEAASAGPSKFPKYGETTAIAEMKASAAHFDPSHRTEACKAILDSAAPSNREWPQLVQIAGDIDSACRHQTLETLREWTGKSLDDPVLVLQIGKAAKSIDPASSVDFAHAIRDHAIAFANDDPALARRLLEMAYETDLAIVNEPETVALKSNLDGVRRSIQNEQLLRFAETQEAKTKRIMGDIGGVLELYKGEHQRYPAASNVNELAAVLQPYLRQPLPTTDGWEAPFEYVISRDGSFARLISGGADREIVASSRDLMAPVRGNDDYGADFIWENGRLVQSP